MNIHSFLGPFIETNERYFASIFCSTHFYHLLLLANFPCEIKKVNKYKNKLKNFYLWIHYHDHIELHLEFQHWRKFLGDDLLLLIILLTTVALKRYIGRIHPLHLRYKNTFCCYALLMDVFPWSPNQFGTHPWDSLQWLVEANLYFQKSDGFRNVFG